MTTPIEPICCNCSGPVGVVICVRDPKLIKCETRGKANSYHGHWIEPKERALHVICSACEADLRAAYRDKEHVDE